MSAGPSYDRPIVRSTRERDHPVPHTELRGDFEGTNVSFTIYLPRADAWEGRFFQYTYPMPIPGVYHGAEATDRAISFALSNGGYAVQAGNTSETVLGYAHAAAAAEFSKQVAADMYGARAADIHGYLYGPSGGSFQTIGALELTEGIWHGFVPMVMATPVSIPGNAFIRAMARMILADKAEQIADAVRPGGSGDPFAGLDEAETAMFRELLAFGTPLIAWANPQYLLGFEDLDGAPVPDGLLGFGSVVRQIDPTYVEDFWSADGYLGTEQSALGERVRAALAAAGDTDENRWEIALPSYYRHQVPVSGPDLYGFDQFRGPDGVPLYPQRSIEVGPMMQAQTTGGATYSGRFEGKVIVVDCLGDSDALPWHADWFAGRIRKQYDDAFDEKFRLYYQESSDHHEQAVTGTRATHLVDFYGTVEQALVDLSAWVERGTPAPASTAYVVEDAQISVPDDAGARRGIQPVVDLAVVCADGAAEYVFHARGEAPIGEIIEIAWDPEGRGEYVPVDIQAASSVEVQLHHTYDSPGIRFPAVRVTSHRDGDVDARHSRVQNLSRVRVRIG